MKKRSTFSQIIILIVISLLCLVLTATIALLFGSVDTNIFDFKNLNFSNMIPIILIGGFISCVTVGIIVLFIAKNVFFKVKKYLSETENNGGKKE